jgi:DNA-binding NarL/FixJ family response regulator
MTSKILVIDDEPIVQDYIEEVLVESFQTAVSILKRSDATDFEQLLSEEVFDVVIIDMKMPGLSGVDALKGLLKSESINRPKAIIAISGMFESDQGYQTEYHIASLSKPIVVEKLVSLVEDVISQVREIEPFVIDEEMVDSFKEEIELVLQRLKELDLLADNGRADSEIFKGFDQLIFGTSGTAAMFEFGDLSKYLNAHSKVLRSSVNSNNPKVKKKTLRLVKNVIEMFECLLPSLGNVEQLNKQRLKMKNELKMVEKLLSEISRMA